MMDIETRLQRLEDIEAIRQLKARYFHACDRKDIGAIKDCFHHGKVLIDYGAIGRFTSRDDFLNVFTEMACHEHIIDMHHGQNAQINWISPSEATAIWDLFFYQINTETGTLTQLAGFYRDRFVREGEWVITETVFEPTSTLVSELDDSRIKVLFAGHKMPLPES